MRPSGPRPVYVPPTHLAPWSEEILDFLSEDFDIFRQCLHLNQRLSSAEFGPSLVLQSGCFRVLRSPLARGW